MTTRADELLAAFVRLADSHGRTADGALIAELAQRCGWGARPITAPLLPSGVSHGVPWGLSIAPGSPELRVFVEAQADPATPATYWQRACDVTTWLERRGASLARWRMLIDGLDGADGFRIWHSVVLVPDAAPRWHAYLCIPGTPRAGQDFAREATRRLGVELPPLDERDRVTIVSLDLADDAPRIKAYVLMPDRAPNELPHERFARAMLGGDRRIWWLVAHELSSAEPRCALHLGIPRHLDEATATSRLRALLGELELPAEAWERARSLGPHHFVTYQLRAGRPRVTAYFVPQVAR